MNNAPLNSKLRTVSQSAPKTLQSRAKIWRQSLLSDSICSPLDRIGELGGDTYGHRGCVNAISWAQDGELLLTGSDDTTVRMWRVDPTSTANDYPLVETAVIETGHTSNIFAAHMLPHSTRIATCARDATVRVSDVGHGLLTGTEGATRHQTSTANVAVLRCHAQATKRVLVEDSPDTFLTVAEDGRVRQHDLRARPHECRRTRSSHSRNFDIDSCGPPLVRLPHELHSISTSPLALHQILVGGDGNYGYLFDRRQSGRLLQEEWGVPVENNLTTCVRRFGRPDHAGKNARGQHITGVRMARSNRHEIILSHNRDGVYLYSTLDDATDSSDLRSRSVLPSQTGPRVSSSAPKPTKILRSTSTNLVTMGPRTEVGPGTNITSSGQKLGDVPSASAVSGSDKDTSLDLDEEAAEPLLYDKRELTSEMGHGDEYVEGDEDEDMDMDSNDDEDDSNWVDDYDDEDLAEAQDEPGEPLYGGVPVVLPRTRYAGAANIRTIKDVNFLGPNDELIASGSDDGNMFLWNKHTGGLHGIYEGDGSIVNVIEPHPSLPLIAVSGIDDSIKLFGPRRGKSSPFDRTTNAERITSENAATSRRPVEVISRADILQLLALGYRMGGEGDEGDDEEGRPACVNQ